MIKGRVLEVNHLSLLINKKPTVNLEIFDIIYFS